MKISLHKALFSWALVECMPQDVYRNLVKDKPEAWERFKSFVNQEIPWIILPDAIADFADISHRSHFETTTDGKIVGIAFPYEVSLKEIDKRTLKEPSRKTSLFGKKEEKYPIIKRVNVGVFDRLNWQHPHYQTMRCNLLQTLVLNETVRCLVDDTNAENSGYYYCNSTGVMLSEEELLKQIDMLEDLCLISFFKYIDTHQEGITVHWFDLFFEDLKLDGIYSRELAQTTLKNAEISRELFERVKSKNFDLTEREKAEFVLTNKPEEVLKKLWESLLFVTIQQEIQQQD